MEACKDFARDCSLSFDELSFDESSSDELSADNIFA